MREGYRKGDLKVVFHGKRMKGSWVLVRTRGWGSSSAASKPSWLLIKHRDEHAEEGDALVERFTTSVTTKRTMEQIGGAVKQRVWHSNRSSSSGDDESPALPRKKTISVAEARAARAKKAAQPE